MKLQLEGIEAGYGAIQALRGVSFDVREGTVAALIGANGAGKSTTLMVISGIVPVWRGRILFEGKVITHLPPEKRVGLGIIQVPEGRRVFPRLTVRENLLMGGYLEKVSQELDRREAWVMALFPRLKERSKQQAGTLSGGEQQMLAIGRALMARPKILLLDEPSLGLAPKLVDTVFEAIEAIHLQGTTILLVEQNAHMALEIAQEAHVVENGRISLSGQAEDLRENPKVAELYLGGGAEL